MGFRKGRQYATTWYNRGLYGPSGKYSRIECFDEALKRDPEYKEAWYEKGLRHDSEAEEAVKCFDKVIALDPKYEDVWYKKGKALSSLEKYEEAIECFDKVIALDPKREDLWHMKGKALSGLKKYEEAIECFDKVTPRHRRDRHDSYGSEVWTSKGDALSGLDDMKKAVKCYDKATRLNDRNGWAWYKKGNAHANDLYEYEEAVKCFDEAIKYNYNMPTAQAYSWYNKGNCLSEGAGNDTKEVIKCFENAIDILDRAMKDYPDQFANAENLVDKADYIKSIYREWAYEALAIYREAEKLDPSLHEVIKDKKRRMYLFNVFRASPSIYKDY